MRIIEELELSWSARKKADSRRSSHFPFFTFFFSSFVL